MKSFLSFTIKLLAVCAVIAGAYVAMGYFLKNKKSKLNELIAKIKESSDIED